MPKGRSPSRVLQVRERQSLGMVEHLQMQKDDGM